MAPSNKVNSAQSPEPPTFTAAEIADMVGGTVEGNPDTRVRSLAPLDQAQEDELGFLALQQYLKYIPDSKARAVLVSEKLKADAEGFESRIVVEAAHTALPTLLEAFFPPKETSPQIHTTAVFGKGTDLGRGVSVGPYSVIGEDVHMGDGVQIGPHVVVGDGCVIGDGSILHPQVTLYPGTQLGRRVILHAGVRLGVDGYGYVQVDGEHRKVPQVGGCVVEDDVEIGANTCIDRGSIGRTVVGKGSKLDNLIQLGHNVQVGKGVLIVSQAGVAGSTRLGDHVVLGGQAGVAGHVEIGEGATVAAQGGAIGDIPPGSVVSGYPARPHREYLRAMGMIFKLPKTLARIRALEERLLTLEEAAGG